MQEHAKGYIVTIDKPSDEDLNILLSAIDDGYRGYTILPCASASVEKTSWLCVPNKKKTEEKVKEDLADAFDEDAEYAVFDYYIASEAQRKVFHTIRKIMAHKYYIGESTNRYSLKRTCLLSARGTGRKRLSASDR